MGHFWRVRGHWREGRTFCAKAMASVSAIASKDVRAKALLTAALMTNRLGESGEAEVLLRETLALARETRNRVLEAGVLNNLGNIISDHGDFPQAHALLEEAVTINRELGNRAWETINLGNIGEVFVGEGDFVAARPPFERALALSRELGNRSLEAAARTSTRSG
jgi:Tfp pilus assembly protein PilF